MSALATAAMAVLAVAITTVTVRASRSAEPRPELPELRWCDCGRELMRLVDDSGIVFCERCDLGL